MRIFDTFPFDGELDLLEHRLRECADAVDAFVLVEAGETYRGTPKAYVFDENRARFAWAAPRLRHVKLPRLGGAGATPRERAAVQRNAIMLALKDAAPDDVVLLLDVDEVPSRALLEELRGQGVERPRRLAMTRHYLFADLLGPRSPCCPTGEEPFPSATAHLRPGEWERLAPAWSGGSGVAVPRRALADASAFDLRFRTEDPEPIREAGRHFCSVDPATRLDRKLTRVFHEEYDGPRERSPVHLARCRLHGVHHRGWWYGERPAGPLPGDVARLIERRPDLAAPPAPPRLARRLVRTWAWLRLWRGWPDAVVGAVDRRFERLVPLLTLPLLAADAGRAVAAQCLPARRAPSPMHH